MTKLIAISLRTYSVDWPIERRLGLLAAAGFISPLAATHVPAGIEDHFFHQEAARNRAILQRFRSVRPFFEREAKYQLDVSDATGRFIIP